MIFLIIAFAIFFLASIVIILAVLFLLILTGLIETYGEREIVVNTIKQFFRKIRLAVSSSIDSTVSSVAEPPIMRTVSLFISKYLQFAAPFVSPLNGLIETYDKEGITVRTVKRLFQKTKFTTSPRARYIVSIPEKTLDDRIFHRAESPAREIRQPFTSKYLKEMDPFLSEQRLLNLACDIYLKRNLLMEEKKPEGRKGLLDIEKPHVAETPSSQTTITWRSSMEPGSVFKRFVFGEEECYWEYPIKKIFLGKSEEFLEEVKCI